jgi:flagellar hook assembly protein FlgD
MTTGPQDPGTPAIPVVTSLNNAYPNPFNPNTTISYSMADAGNARIDIYNLRGQILRSFERDHANAGNYSFNWDGKDASGNFVGSGIYLYRMTSGNYSATKKLILSK